MGSLTKLCLLHTHSDTHMLVFSDPSVVGLCTHNGFTQGEPTSQLTDYPANSSSYSQSPACTEHQLHGGGSIFVIPKLGASPTVCFHVFVRLLGGERHERICTEMTTW